MKLLAVVTTELKEILSRQIGCDIEFQDAWKYVNPEKLRNYAYIIVMGALVEDPHTPITLWGIASEIRYFGTPALFCDVSFQAANLIPDIYPQFKIISFQGDPAQFLLQLRTCAPNLFFDNPKFSNSTFSASANARRYENDSSISNAISSLSSIAGANRSHSSENIIPQPSALTGSFGPVSSIPLGLKKIDRSPSNEPASSPNFRKQGMGSGRPDDNLLDAFTELSSVSSISGISSISDALNEARSGDGAIDANNHVNPAPASTPQPQHTQNTPPIHIKRTPKDVQNGNIEFGNIIRIMQTIVRLKLTGTLTIQNDTRSLRIDFRQGSPFATSAPALILSALGWTSGDYAFDSSKMLSANAQPIDLKLLFQTAAQQQLPLNPLLQALEHEFNSYIVLTSTFNPSNHASNTGKWWEKCDGNTRFSEIMMKSGVAMDVISRDIYLAWLCDDIVFLKSPSQNTIVIDYDAAPEKPTHREELMAAELEDVSNANLSQIQEIRENLTKIRDDFSKQSGYAMLGLKPGCGIKALDTAYYAWINRYHADRFVRYNDSLCIKLANELLMLMNATYTKLSKSERMNTSSFSNKQFRKKISENDASAVPDVSPRIGAGRGRINTLASAALVDNEKLHVISDELKSLEASEGRQAAIPRPHLPIRPSSHAEPHAPNPAIPQPKILKMSDVMARRSAQINMEAASTNAPPCKQPGSPSVSFAAQSSDASKPTQNLRQRTSSQPWASPNATPQQHFATAQKKITLGLSQDALTAIQWAIEGDPENPIYKVYEAYAQFLVDPSTQAKSIETIKNIISDMRFDESKTPHSKKDLFAPFYFLGKMYIAACDFKAANQMMQNAAKIDPGDLDTQRCLRYLAMQLEKQQHPVEENKGLFARFKEKFSKS